MRWLPNPYAIAQQLANVPDLTSIIRSGGKTSDAFLLDTFLSGRRQKTVTSAVEVFERITDSFDRPVTLQQALDQSKQIWANEGYTAEEIARVLPNLMQITSGPALASTAFADADDLIVDNVSYLDPMQGPVGNCYLISAMSSLAWAEPRKLTTRLNASGFDPPADRAFKWQFHDDDGAEADEVRVTGRIMMKQGQPRNARSGTSAEDWPSLLEKAYVVQVCGIQGEPNQANYNSTDAKNDGSKPQRACQALFGGETQAEQLHTIAGEIIFLQEQDSRLKTPAGVMSKPVMAWTKTKQDMRAIEPDYWRVTGLWHDHAYSVLGVMRSNNVVRHVVLRNPLGLDTDPDREGYHNGPWEPDGRPSVPLNKNGVFAISRKLFYDYFGNIGWVDL